jgi:hypothetical protein
MATKASSDIVWKKHDETSLGIVKALIKFGWSGSAEGRVWYLPKGDHGSYDWKNKPFGELDAVLAELYEKEKLGEILGIELIWKDLWEQSIIGGQFLFGIVPNSISINWNITRKPLISDESKTDFDWYEPRIIKPLVDNGVKIISLTSEDADSGGDIIQRRFYDEATVRNILLQK